MTQPLPVDFQHLGIAPKILDILGKLKFVTPTPIQHKAIPPALEGQDVIGIAQTGTGKTLAFGIPLAQRLSVPGTQALILVPTRELAQQVEEVLRKILQPLGISSTVLIGGASMHMQHQALRRNPRVIIATPGRLMDHLEQRTAHLRNTRVLVLDEADRMFDMGFAPQVERILTHVPKDRQTLLFSATMPPDILKLATGNMKLPIHVEVAPQGTAAEKVTQELFIVREDAGKGPLLKLLLTQYRGPVLLFTRTKARARRVAKSLNVMGHSVAEIHSDRSMPQRKQAVEGFKSGRFRILVATDIASRGIDVSNIELVLNYDLPDDIENFVHRIGRTGRAGKEGHAISFATPDQGMDVARIERLIRKPLPVAQRPEVPSAAFQSGSFSSPRQGGRPHHGSRPHGGRPFRGGGAHRSSPGPRRDSFSRGPRQGGGHGGSGHSRGGASFHGSRSGGGGQGSGHAPRHGSSRSHGSRPSR